MTISNYYEFGPDADKVKSLIFMLHGVGSNGQDLISLAPYLANAVPDAMFISPDAPFACDMVPPGYPNSFQWFSLQDRDPKVMLDGVKGVFDQVEEFVTAQAARFDVPMDKVVLLGFSQGTMTSLHCAPRFKDKVAGVLGYSGALLWDGDCDASALQKMPIHLIHGDYDDVVPVAALKNAQETLSAHGYDIKTYVCRGLTHSIDQAGIDKGMQFLKNVLS